MVDYPTRLTQRPEVKRKNRELTKIVSAVPRSSNSYSVATTIQKIADGSAAIITVTDRAKPLSPHKYPIIYDIKGTTKSFIIVVTKGSLILKFFHELSDKKRPIANNATSCS